MDTQEIRYPIGEFIAPLKYNSAELSKHINRIKALPEKMASSVIGLTSEQLDTPYRENGWTARQVVHHVADSHINAYCRFKLALTENRPAILPYDQDKWAFTSDSLELPVEVSLDILKSIHMRWCASMDSLSIEDWHKEFYHPEHDKTFTIYQLAANYAWHGDHHYRHITDLKVRNDW